MVALCTSSTTILPLACEAQIVCTLATDVIITEMVIEVLWIVKFLAAIKPKTGEDNRGVDRGWYDEGQKGTKDDSERHTILVPITSRIVRKLGIIVVTGRRGRGSMERISRRGRHDVVRERKEGDRDLRHDVLWR